MQTTHTAEQPPRNAPPAEPLKPFRARYTLRSGARGELRFLSTDSCTAAAEANEAFGGRMAKCSVRPA